MPLSFIGRTAQEYVEGVTGFLSKFWRKPARLTIPPPPSTLLTNPRDAYYVPRPNKKYTDSPLATLYRIYWAIVMDDTITMRNEIEYFWTQKGLSWKIENIPKPPDSDAERFAVVAAIPHALAAAFNRLINLGLPREASSSILTDEDLSNLEASPKKLEVVPQWAIDAPPLEHALSLPTKDLGAPSGPDIEGADPFMALKNVLVWRLHIFFT